MNLSKFLLVCLSLWTFSVYAQDQKYWSDQKLQISDFTGSPAGSTPFRIRYDIAYSRKNQKIEKTFHSHYQAKAIFIPSGSWIAHDSLQALRLKYCNVVFDFVELYARRLDDEINVTENFENSKTETIRALNDAVSMLANDTKLGTDSKRVDFWEHHIDSVLKITYRKEIPDYNYDRLTIGYYWGASHNYLTGELGKQFSSPFSVSNGFFLSWKRVMYAIQLTFLGRSVPSKPYYNEHNEFGDTARFTMTYNTFFVGYEIIKKPQFVLTPYAGLSTFRMSLRDQDPLNKAYHNPLKASFNVGLGLDFRSRAFFQSNSCQMRYGLSARASFSPYEYLPKLNGNCLSFVLGITFYLDAIKNYL